MTPWTVALQAPLSMGILQARTRVGCHTLLRGDLPNPGIKPRSPTLQADSLPAELPGKPKNTGVGSLSLLQRIFLTQELNQGLLHCRQILYQLSYQGSPSIVHYWPNFLKSGGHKNLSCSPYKTVFQGAEQNG